MPRTQKYEASNETDTLDELTKRLAADLRKHVRKLDASSLFTPEWVSMIDALLHVSNIATMEHQLPRGSDSTLWEGDELTVRFMLEEGKLNLCIRLLHSYCNAVVTQRPGTPNYDSWLAATAVACQLDDAEQLRFKMLQFEQTLGTLVRCALQHVESVQTCDLNELFEHCSDVLTSIRAMPEAAVGFDRTQTVLVPQYLSSVLARLDQLDEDRVMSNVEKFSLVRRQPPAPCRSHPFTSTSHLPPLASPLTTRACVRVAGTAHDQALA